MTTNTASTAPANPYVGKTLADKYKLERLIGRGGMGLVYLAHEGDKEQDLVVKMLAPHWADDPHAVARFEREGRRLAQLSHPNIVELFDIGWQDGQSFIVMEYIHGEPLRHYLGRREDATMGLREFAPLADQILAGVAYAHEQSMMLRDIKPSNIMLCERDGKTNVVKMLDFGLAKLVDGDDVEVTKANVIGTAGYLAPEQIKGEPADVRVDVYALGILFFVMLTGRSPIIGENDGAVLYNHVHGKPIRLTSLLPDDHDLPAAVIDLVHRCMEKNPDDRPADAGALRKLLRDVLPDAMFEPPVATVQTRASIESYHRGKLERGVAVPDDASSNEWTRPRLRELLAKKGAGLRPPTEDDEVTGRKRTMGLAEGKPTSKPLAKPLAKPRPRTTAKSRTGAMPRPKPLRTGSSKSVASGPPPPPPGGRVARGKSNTMMGLAAPTESSTQAPTRRPPPARTPVSARMERLPSHRKAEGKAAETKMMASRGGPAVVPLPVGGDEESSPGSTLLGAPQPEPRPVRGRTQEMIGGSAADRTQMMGSGSSADAPRGLPRTLGSSEPGDEIPLVVEDEDEVGGGRLPTLPPPPITEPIGLDDPLGVEADRRPSRALALFGALAVASVASLGGLAIWAMSGDDAAKTQVADGSSTPAGAQADKGDAGGAGAAGEDGAGEDEAGAQEAEAESAPSAESDLEGEAGEALQRVSLQVPAQAEVFVDGGSQGTGLTELRLAPGVYEIRVKQAGYRPWEGELTVEADGAEPLSVQLEPWRSAKSSESEPVADASSTPKPKPKSEPEPTPAPASKPSSKPAPPKPPPADPPKPKPSSDSDDSDLFIPSKKPKKDDGGIFLPVGPKK